MNPASQTHAVELGNARLKVVKSISLVMISMSLPRQGKLVSILLPVYYEAYHVFGITFTLLCLSPLCSIKSPFGALSMSPHYRLQKCHTSSHYSNRATSCGACAGGIAVWREG